MYKSRCPSVCLCKSHLGNDASRLTRDLLSKGVSLILEFRKAGFFFKALRWFSVKKNVFWVSLRTTLRCIVGELPRGGSVAVAVCGSDWWQSTGET